MLSFSVTVNYHIYFRRLGRPALGGRCLSFTWAPSLHTCLPAQTHAASRVISLAVTVALCGSPHASVTPCRAKTSRSGPPAPFVTPPSMDPLPVGSTLTNQSARFSCTLRNPTFLPSRTHTAAFPFPVGPKSTCPSRPDVNADSSSTHHTACRSPACLSFLRPLSVFSLFFLVEACVCVCVGGGVLSEVSAPRP